MGGLDELSRLAPIISGAGNVALLVAVWFILKASERLARIEKHLELIADHLEKRRSVF